MLFLLLLLGLSFCNGGGFSTSCQCPSIVLDGIPFKCTLTMSWKETETKTTTVFNVTSWNLDAGTLLSMQTLEGSTSIKDSREMILTVDNRGSNTIDFDVTDSTAIVSCSKVVHCIPAWICLLPTIVTIVLAFVTRNTLMSLFVGTWVGASISEAGNIFMGFLDTMNVYFVGAITDVGHAKVVTFTLLLGGALGIVMRSGGALGFAGFCQRFATNKKKAEILCFVSGVILFFDDYANTLVIGNTMRPIIQAVGMTPEKFSFLVDATSATIASAAPVSSWIGFELAMIEEGFNRIGIQSDPYIVFLQTIPFRFYSIFMMSFLVANIASQSEFGPMATAEQGRDECMRPTFFSSLFYRVSTLPWISRIRRLRRVGYNNHRHHPHAEEGSTTPPPPPPSLSVLDVTEELDSALVPVPGRPQRIINALLPISVLVLALFIGMAVDGSKKLKIEIANLENQGLATPSMSIQNVFARADSYSCLIWGSLLCALSAFVLVAVQRLMSFEEATTAFMKGLNTMINPLLILIIAWALGDTFEDLHVSQYVVSKMSHSIRAEGLPVTTFIICAALSFGVGSSWGTMAIMFPLVMPLSHALAPNDTRLMTVSIASILAGSVFGDHCSPIADTTVLTSLASGCNHIAHVQTQLPYAFIVGITAALFGFLPAGYGVHPALCFLMGTTVVSTIMVVFGSRRGQPSKATRLLSRLGVGPPLEDASMNPSPAADVMDEDEL